MRDSAARLLLLLSEYHPLVIEGMGSYDARAPGTVAATVSRLLRQRWEASPPGKPVILVTQGDPLAARGISAITRAVASALSFTSLPPYTASFAASSAYFSRTAPSLPPIPTLPAMVFENCRW